MISLWPNDCAWGADPRQYEIAIIQLSGAMGGIEKAATEKEESDRIKCAAKGKDGEEGYQIAIT